MRRRVKNLTTPEAVGIKSLKGSPEFEELCRKVTHIDKIRNGISVSETIIFAEVDNTFKRRRYESSTKLKGE